MAFYENEICPVCNRQFEEGDDVVFCPECGTPHHRECYRLAGHCVNEGLHGSGYVYQRTNAQPEKSVEEPAAPGFVGFFSSENAPQEDENARSAPAAPFMPFPDPAVMYEKDTDTINGESVADVAATVRTNVARYITAFRRMEASGKKTSWNWGAFFFGSFYLFYRKMYRTAISFFCGALALMFGCGIAIMKLAPNYVKAMQDMALASQSATPEEFMKSYEALQSIPDLKNAVAVFYVFLLLLLVLRIVIAIFADSFYRNTVTATVKTVKNAIAEGGELRATGAMNQEISLSPEQMKRLYLAKRGGVSIAAPALALLVLYLVILFI
jgi:hypothetical protein